MIWPSVKAIEAEGFRGTTAQLRRSAALHYHGQSYELVVPVPAGLMDGAMVAHLEEAFGRRCLSISDYHPRT